MHRKVIALRALKAASMFLKKQYCADGSGKEKKDGTLVCEADLGSEQIIIQMLQQAFPDDAVLSEECGKIRGESDFRWILDPLDGTHNFLAGIPIFGILLALEKRGEIILSFCVFPITNEVFFAEKGRGAFFNGKRICVSSATSLKGSVFLGDGNRNLELRTIMQDVQPFYENGCRFRFLGEGSFGMTCVARGTVLAATFRPEKVWDIPAACLLVGEAGGRVTDIQGNAWDLEPRQLLATNGIVHQDVLSMFT